MSAARARSDARKKKILERGSDRMAIATGQQSITGTTSSWRENRGVMALSASVDDDEVVIEISDSDKLGTSDEKVHSQESNMNSDMILDEIVDSIDISKLLPDEDSRAHEGAGKRVLAACKDYDPVEKEKSIAKRKALEQEIVKQTEEFDRLAQLAMTKNKSTAYACESEKIGINHDDAEVDKLAKTEISSAGTASISMKFSKSQWVQIIRCALLIVLGGCIGFWSSQDTARISSLHPSAISDYLSAASVKTGLDNSAAAVSEEIVMSVLPTIWREDCSFIYVLVHYPVLVAAAMMFVAKQVANRLLIVDSVLAGDKGQGGLLASALAVAMGDFSGITSPLYAFAGDACLFTLSIFLAAALFQGGVTLPSSSPAGVHAVLDNGGEF